MPAAPHCGSATRWPTRIAGITAAFAIVCAVLRRNRSGEGGFVDVSMLDSTLVTMGWVISNYLIAGVEPQPHGNDNFTAAPSGAFRTRDGLLNIAANKQEQFVALVKVLGCETLASDERFAKRESRKRHRVALTEALEAVLVTRSAQEWEPLLNAAGVPAGRVVTVPQALAFDQVRARDFLQTFTDVHGAPDRPITVAKAGFKLTDGDPEAAMPPPALGTHTEEVLAGLGYTDADVSMLRKAGAI